jgi:hypothetical protein
MEPADVAGQRMRRMGLLGPLLEKPVDVVRHHLAMQSQDVGPAKWSIGQRLNGLTDREVERKISDGSILRTHVLRPTWHFVARTDLRWLMALSGPRVQRGLESRYRKLGLDAKTRARGERVIAKHLEGGNHLTRRELGAILRKARIDPEGQRMPHLLSHCELEAIICSGQVKGKQQTFALFDERVPTGPRLDRDKALVELVRRYLNSHGPATLADLSWWSGLTTTDLKAGLEGLAPRASSETLDGLTLWWTDKEPRGRPRRPVVQLLQAYDELVVGYTESRYLGDPRRARIRAAFIDRSVPNGTVMVGSRVLGHWRRSTKEKVVEVEAHLYEPLRGAQAKAMEKAVGDLGRFVGKEVRVQTNRI